MPAAPSRPFTLASGDPHARSVPDALTGSFARARHALDAAHGKHVTASRLGRLLGISPERVSKCTAGTLSARPSLVLATLYAARVGYDRASETADDTAGAPARGIACIVAALSFDAAHVGRLLGLSASRFARMRSENGRQQTTPRHYLLALLELRARYGPGTEYHGDAERASAWLRARRAGGVGATPVPSTRAPAPDRSPIAGRPSSVLHESSSEAPAVETALVRELPGDRDDRRR